MSIGELEGAIMPDLAGEFTETLCAYWRKNRDKYTTDDVPGDFLYVALDSLCSVVLEEEA